MTQAKRIKQGVYLTQHEAAMVSNLAQIADLGIDDTYRQVFLLGLCCFASDFDFKLKMKLVKYVRDECFATA